VTGPATEDDWPAYYMQVIGPAGAKDPVVFRASARHMNLLDPPDALRQNNEVRARVLALVRAGEVTPRPRPAGPTRDELLAILHRARARA
jgi:hypothetical protein